VTNLTDDQIREWLRAAKADLQPGHGSRNFVKLAEDDLRLREELAEMHQKYDLREVYGTVFGEITAERDALREKLMASERARDGVFKELDEVDQRLGKALGYPHYYLKDGKVVGPDVEGAVKDERVCTGDHVPGTLAAEAAGRISTLCTQLERLGEDALRLSGLLHNWSSVERRHAVLWPEIHTAHNVLDTTLTDLPTAGRAHREERYD